MPPKAPTSFEEPGGEPEPASYDHWFRAKVREAMTSEKPFVPHDEAMVKVASILAERRRRAVHVDDLTDAEADFYIKGFSAAPTADPLLPDPN